VAIQASEPPRQCSRAERHDADGEPGHDEEERLGASGTERRLHVRRSEGGRHLEEAQRHAEPRDGVATRALVGEIVPARLSDLTGLGEGHGRTDHLAAVGIQAHVAIVSDGQQRQEHDQDGRPQHAVSPGAACRRPAGSTGPTVPTGSAATLARANHQAAAPCGSEKERAWRGHAMRDLTPVRALVMRGGGLVQFVRADLPGGRISRIVSARGTLE
jgi:hypothetical protein